MRSCKAADHCTEPRTWVYSERDGNIAGFGKETLLSATWVLE